jgi:hypothetical protein
MLGFRKGAFLHPAHKNSFIASFPIILVTLFSLILSACSESATLSLTPPTSPPHLVPNVTVAVDKSTLTTVSQLSLGITHVDQGLDYPQGSNDLNAINNAKALIKQAFPYEDTPIMAWGAPDPWPDPTQPEPTNWGYLDSRMQLIADTGGIPVITLSEAPWWMKGQLQANGTTSLLTASDEWSDIAYNSRILDNEMGNWLHLVQRVAERYMAPPYNVRYFQVWNELKGYYNPGTNAYDYTTSPGNPSGPNATNGYTYMYNQVYMRLMQVATELHISQGAIKVGGPYVVVDSWSSPNQSHLSNLREAYGIYDERSLDVILYWLQHKVGAGFIALDTGNANKDNVNTADAFTSSERFADLTTWLRSLNPKRYPGATTLPVWFAEWYAMPYGNTPDNNYNNAIKAYAMIKFLEAGGAVAFSWGWSINGASDSGIWTPTQAGGGKPLPVYFSYKAFKDYFGPGTQIYKTTVSDPESIEALASANHIMLVNKTARSFNVGIGNTVVVLKSYQVETIAH